MIDRNALKIAQWEAEGRLNGHVAFMLICHDHGVVEERHWHNLRKYHDEVERAAKAVTASLFKMAEEVNR